MSTHLRSLRTLIQVRRRQHTRLEEALGLQRAALAEREAAHDTARAHHAACTRHEHEGAEQRRILLGQRFEPQAVLALDLRQAALAAATVQAAQAMHKSQEALAAQNEAVCDAQREVRRNAQRIESFEERLTALLRERDQCVDEAADEESGEAFTARLVARRRRAAQASRHA